MLICLFVKTVNNVKVQMWTLKIEQCLSGKLLMNQITFLMALSCMVVKIMCYFCSDFLRDEKQSSLNTVVQQFKMKLLL